MNSQNQIVPLFGQVQIAPQERAVSSEDELLQTWAEAFDLWTNGLKSTNTQRVYRKAWHDFLAFTGKAPWLVTKADTARWAADMRARGLSVCTQQQRISAVSAFYKYAERDYSIVRADGKEIPLHTTNPAQSKSLRTKVDPYGKAAYLGNDEARALLRAIHRDTVQGFRDYALVVSYLFTGRRNTEIRSLKWGDLEYKNGRAWYRWSGKGKENQLVELPLPAWQAICDYLKAAGRLDKIQEGDFIFTALSNRATRLPNVGESFEPTHQALSMREVGRLLKVYCKRAGLDPKKVHVHTLRHTAAMLRKEAGDDIEAISNFLAHSSLAVTQIYLHTVEGHRDTSWAKVESLLGL